MLITEEETKLLDEAVGGLRGQDRLLIDLCYRNELHAREIAALLQVSPGAVYTRKNRILGKLRKALEVRN